MQSIYTIIYTCNVLSFAIKLWLFLILLLQVKECIFTVLVSQGQVQGLFVFILFCNLHPSNPLLQEYHTLYQPLSAAHQLRSSLEFV